MSILSTKQLTKQYGTEPNIVKALDGVSISIEPGEFVAIIGTSGSGKSTLLNMLGGLDRPTSGAVRVDNYELGKLKDEDLTVFRRQRIGFIFQNYNLMDTLTTLENAAFPLMLKGVPVATREAEAKKILEAVGLSGHLAHDPDELSGGQQQRVSIARALITKPKIVFADEPTGNLDSSTAEQVMDILRAVVRGNGTTLLMVTHDEDKAKYADRIVHIADGEILKIEDNRI